MTVGALDEPTLASVAALPGPRATGPQLKPGRVLADRYRIEAHIGAGGMAAVYRATDLDLRRPVAMKVFGPAGDDLDLPGIDDVPTRVTREIRTHAGLRHPGLIQLLDAQLPEPAATPAGPAPWGYLVLELASGGTLAEALRNPLPLNARALAVNVGEALEYLHGQGIAHCDLKPANIVFDVDGRAKLIDLGIAVNAAAPCAQVPSGWLAGTARYASPEQLRGRALTAATDIYSLGLVLLDALCGPRPAPAGLPIVDLQPVVVPLTVGPQWFWLLTAMLSDDPARRPSAAGVLDAVSWMGGPAR